MAKISKYIKLDKNVLLEYVYNDGNLLSEPYNLLVNSKDKTRSYMAYDTSGTGNQEVNQLFSVDPITYKYGKVDPSYYSFLQVKNYSAPSPIKHDTLKFHIPINWTFGEYLGFNIRVYAFDSNNRNQYDISNFYFDMTDVDQQELLNFTSPPLLFQEKLWGKNITIEVPAVSDVSSQLSGNRPIDNSINSNLTNGDGLSLTSPVFIEFRFINNIQTINGVTTYLLEAPISTSIPQTPEYEKLGLRIENSTNGDFFEIYGTYDNTIGGFKKFIDDSVYQDKRYYVQYDITMYEQNVRGKTITYTVTDNFNEKIDYRPIIKYSTTTAIIDVEMRLIDAVDGSYIIRRASYGMLQDEVSKYSLNLTKINLTDAYKPKIYNIKSSINPDLVGVSNAFGIIPINNNPKSPPIARVNTDILYNPANNNNRVTIEQVNVPFPVLVDRYNIMAKSDSTILDTKSFYGFGKLQILLYPFDNILSFSIATGTAKQPKYLDMTGYKEIKLTIKNDSTIVSFTPFIESGEIDLVNGMITFKINEAKISDIKKIYNSGVNIFYITGKNSLTTSVIYTGLFKIYDDINNIDDLNQQVATSSNPEIILDPTINKQIATVTTRAISNIPIEKGNGKSTTNNITSDDIANQFNKVITDQNVRFTDVSPKNK